MEQKDVYLNDFQSFLGKFMDKIIGFLPSLIGAIIVLFVGVWICRLIRKFVRRLMITRSVDITIQNFVNELLRWVLYIILFLTVIQKIGVPVLGGVFLFGDEIRVEHLLQCGQLLHGVSCRRCCHRLGFAGIAIQFCWRHHALNTQAFPYR